MSLRATLLLLLFSSSLFSFETNQGRILFLIQQNEHRQAIDLYQARSKIQGEHDFEFLHQMGIKILESGFHQDDPESQLLTLFGASISAHEEAYYILEESLKSRFPEIQLIALEALARIQNDRADQALLRALGSPSLAVRYEAVRQLCKKKHPQAIIQAESLMYKSPRFLMPIYPPLFAMIEDPQATKILRRLLNQTSGHVRLITLLSLIKYKRDDLLPQIRTQASHFDCSQQEASAYALGEMQDEQAQPKLKTLTRSQHPTVALAAQFALYLLGREEAISIIEEKAGQGDLFAISALGKIPDHPRILIQLLSHKNAQIRFNAGIALLQQNDLTSFPFIQEILLRDQRDLAFTLQPSPGQVFKTWKVTSSASQLFNEDEEAYQQHFELKRSLLKKVRELSAPHFLTLAHQIFNKQQNELVPYTAELLEDLATKEAIACLKEHHQQLGAPLVRNYCNLALYRLKEEGPYGEQLRKWIKNQNKTQFIRFKAFNPWTWEENHYSLTPEQSSQLLISAFEALAAQQEQEGIDTLLEAIATGHEKNKYALAGLLLRATQ